MDSVKIMRWWMISGALFFASFLHPWLWFAVVLGAAAFLHASVTAMRMRTVFWGSVIAGTMKAAGGLIWIWHTYPVVPLGLETGGIQLALIGVYWLLDAFSIGIGMSVCAMGMHTLIRRSPWTLFAFPLLFVLGEIAGSFTSSLVSLGPGSGVNINFGFGYVGYVVAHASILLPFAMFGGVYAIGVAVGTFALAGYIVIRRSLGAFHTFVPITILVIFTMIAVAGWLMLPNIPDDPVTGRVIAIETRFDATLLSSPGGYEFKKWQIVQAVEAALALQPDLILLPEDSRFVHGFDSSEAAFSFVKEQALGDTIIVDSARTTDHSGMTVLRAFFFDTNRDSIYSVDKQRLVPQGEYVPYLVTWFLKVVGKDTFIDQMNRNQTYRPGPRVGYNTFPSNIPSILFCFEAAVPFSVKSIMRTDATALVLHPVSHSWFHDTFLLLPHLSNMLRVQAVWNGATIVSAGNMASNRAYLPDGSVISGKAVMETPYWSLYEF